ncbi:glycosyltransferase [Varibaculum cambriense]|uniref:glycosyltransferase n=1 Tax=Varibaculum cambriense TaxID=184870 RepID=UPI0029046105|nr:glycosyltransferase [Varibaculum cambriense]MDU1223534.1 glycosyltransferase [Varibaculum cambriense]
MRTLAIVLTDQFPYEVGEEFFEQELPYLSKAVSDILIIPVRLEQGAKKTRILPANAVSFLPVKQKATNKWWKIVKNLPRIIFSGERMVNWFQFRHPIRVLVDLVFASNTYDVYNRILPQLKQFDFSKYDSIVLYSYWFYTGTSLARLIQKGSLKSVPSYIISRGHAYDIDEDDTLYGYLPCRPYLLKIVDFIFPISNYAAKFITEKYPKYCHKVKIRRLGVPAKSGENREKPGGVPVIVSCSHMAEYKRVPLIIDTIAALENKGINLKWIHIGESNPTLIEKTRRYANSRIRKSEVKLLGYVPNPKVREFYRATPITAFVNASNGEGVPVSIMEAQAAGIPVVATDAGGTSEIVHDGENGIVVPVDIEPDEFASALEKVFNLSPDRYRSWSQDAIETWKKFSDADKQYQDFSREVTNLANSYRSS